MKRGENPKASDEAMKKILFIFILFILLVGCCPCKNTGSTQRDSVRVETVIRTEYIKDTIVLEIPVERVMQVAEDSSHLETQYAVSDALLLSDGKLYHTLENKAGKRPVEVETRVEYRDSIVYRDRAVREVVEVERHFTTFQRVELAGFWVLLTVFVGVGALKVKKMLGV